MTEREKDERAGVREESRDERASERERGGGRKCMKVYE